MAFISIVKFAQEVLEELFASWKTLNIDDDPQKNCAPFWRHHSRAIVVWVLWNVNEKMGHVCGKALSFDYPSIIPHSNPFPALDNLLVSFINQLSMFCVCVFEGFLYIFHELCAYWFIYKISDIFVDSFWRGLEWNPFVININTLVFIKAFVNGIVTNHR